MRYKLTARQSQAFETLDDPTVDSVMYGGAKGGGKISGVFPTYKKGQNGVSANSLSPLKGAKIESAGVLPTYKKGGLPGFSLPIKKALAGLKHFRNSYSP